MMIGTRTTGLVALIDLRLVTAMTRMVRAEDENARIMSLHIAGMTMARQGRTIEIGKTNKTNLTSVATMGGRSVASSRVAAALTVIIASSHTREIQIAAGDTGRGCLRTATGQLHAGTDSWEACERG